jgi:hemerythrin
MLLMWTGNLSVGVKDFDDDHKRLIRIINELHSAIQDAQLSGKVPEEEIEIALHRLENYLQYHCAREELYMANTGYPDLAEHRQEHTQFGAKIVEMRQRFHGSSSLEDAQAVMDFVYNWLTHHINVTDKKFATHMHANGIY